MNQNYDQVAELVSSGSLSWERDVIIAMLCLNTTFDGANEVLSEIDGQKVAVVPIPGRWYDNGLGMGLPAAFQMVSQGLDYQIIVAKDTGNNDPLLLAFIDSNADDSPINVQHTGTLIIRPVLPDSGPPPEQPPGIGVWIRLVS